MNDIGMIHLVTSLVAIVTGGWVVWRPKGTRWHRTIGHAYLWSMIGVLATAFSIYDLTGSFGPFHFAAIVGTVTLAGGMWAVLARRPRKGWIEAHAVWMSWSYVGLMAAFVAESLTRFVMPAVQPFLQGDGQAWGIFWASVGVATFGVTAVGWYLIKTRLEAAVAATPAQMRRERDRLREVEREADVPA